MAARIPWIYRRQEGACLLSLYIQLSPRIGLVLEALRQNVHSVLGRLSTPPLIMAWCLIQGWSTQSDPTISTVFR